MDNLNKQLAAKIADSGGKLTPLAIQGKLESWKAQHFQKLVALASTKEEAEKLFVICMNTISKVPKLLECTSDSIIACVLTSFQMKLYPGAMQECCYIPFGNIATFVPQYQGIVKLCYNSGFIKSVKANVVWEGEEFEYREGIETYLYHRPDLDIDHDKAKRVAVYCVVKTKFDDVQVTVLSPRFIQGIKARSKGAKKPDSPWNGNTDDVDWMWKKTSLKQALKLIPKSSEVSQALEADDAAEMDKPVGAGKIVDLTLNMPMSALEEPKTIEHQKEPESVKFENKEPSLEGFYSDLEDKSLKLKENKK